jgi:hypothetical protein
VGNRLAVERVAPACCRIPGGPVACCGVCGEWMDASLVRLGGRHLLCEPDGRLGHLARHRLYGQTVDLDTGGLLDFELPTCGSGARDCWSGKSRAPAPCRAIRGSGRVEPQPVGSAAVDREPIAVGATSPVTGRSPIIDTGYRKTDIVSDGTGRFAPLNGRV